MAPNSAVLLGLVSVLLFGLRHGVDYDHIAAITDLTSSESSPKRAMRLGFAYALGHGVVILVLGTLAVVFREFLPASVDGVMERMVGVTLIILGVWVVVSLFRTRHNHSAFTMQSRFTMIARMMRGIANRFFPSSGYRKQSTPSYGNRGAFVIGMIHGVGAETPTQLGLFLFAAGVGGRGLGMLGVFIFVVGLLISNTVMSALSVGVFRVGTRRELIYRSIASLTAIYSLVIGCIFVFGTSSILPSLP